jgi:alkylation response protein AidB-like acyl-CoA dehydrogenase
MPKRQKDVQGLGLAALNRIAGSKMLEALRLKKPTEKALYSASKAGFKVAGMTGKPFKTVKNLLSPARLEQHKTSELFDITPTEEQAMIVESVRRFSAEALRTSSADAESHCEVSEEIWKGAFELGLGLMSVPEKLGGAAQERSPVSSALVAEALGWGDMGQALALLAPIGVANALASWGSSDQQRKSLASFASDNPPDAAIALLEPQALADVSQPRCYGSRQDDGASWLVNGEKALVPLGQFADLLIVSINLEGQGPRLVLLEGNAHGLNVKAEPGMGLRAASLGRLSLQDVSVKAEQIVGDESHLHDAIALARLGWCALAVGASQATLDYVIPYVNERKAFGEPVSHRQGVAFPIANMGIELDAMRLMVWRACALAEQGKPFSREAALAHRFCADKAMQIGSDGVQMLGGHGFVKEHPVERWYRDLRAVGTMEGGLLL